MDPSCCTSRTTRGTAPRARGDGPSCRGYLNIWTPCSPRTRGWTHQAAVAADHDDLLPAHAGMDPRTQSSHYGGVAAPRARGDGPRPNAASVPTNDCSPRTRGWTQEKYVRQAARYLLPAHAGMDPRTSATTSARPTAPRARGDGPRHRAPPDRAARCSPRTRGWTQPWVSALLLDQLLPAHAGMDPSTSRARRISGPAPPAHAGMDPTRSSTLRPERAAPRARGDGPGWRVSSSWTSDCSSRTRGWTLAAQAQQIAAMPLPAYAGMELGAAKADASRGSAPRARGVRPRQPQAPGSSAAPRIWGITTPSN